MLFSVISMFILVFLKFSSNVTLAQEPMCSKFSCEEQLLEKMIRQELKVEVMQNDIKKTQEDVSKNLKELNENMKKPSVAFFAHNVVDLKLEKADKVIVFTKTTTNEGSGYDIFTGVFTAPVGGLYQFIVSYCSYPTKYSPLALVMSGNVIARSANYHKDSSYSCSSFPTVIRVELGEKIWVKCIYGDSGYALHENNWTMNSFSGFLINE